MTHNAKMPGKAEKSSVGNELAGALEKKARGPAELSLKMFTPFDMGKHKIRGKVAGILDDAMERGMKNKEFAARLEKEELTNAEKQFALGYYTLYRLSFRESDREEPNVFIRYNREEPPSKLEDNGYYSFTSFFFDESGKAAAMVSGAFIQGEEKDGNVLFIGYRAVARGKYRDKKLSGQLVEHAIAEVKKTVGQDVSVHVGEFDRPSDYEGNQKEYDRAVGRLEWAEKEERVAVEGLRWPQPIFDYHGDEQVVKPPEKQEDLILTFKTVGEKKIETREDVEQVVRTVFEYYGLSEATIEGTGETAMERYVAYAMENVPGKPELVKPTELKDVGAHDVSRMAKEWIDRAVL